MTQGFISALMCLGVAVLYALLVFVSDHTLLVGNRYSKEWTRSVRMVLWLSALIFPVLFLLDHVHATQFTALLLLPFQVILGLMVLVCFGAFAFDIFWAAAHLRSPEESDTTVLQKSKYVLLFEEHNSSSFSRKTIWRRRMMGVWAGIVLLLSAVGILRAFQSPAVKVTKIDIAKLPAPFANLSITHLSDLHLTPLTPKSRIESLVKEINASKPDLVVLTGDMFQSAPGTLHDHLEEFRDISAPLGVFVVPGHLERFWNYQDWKVEWLKLGWTLLENSGYSLYRGNQSICLIGRNLRDSGWLHMPSDGPDRIPTHICPTGAPKILLTHEVDPDDGEDQQFDLVVAGDTMGGQFWPITWYSRLTKPIASGERKIGNAVFSVTAGMGFWLVPFRVGSPPEYSRLILTSATPTEVMHSEAIASEVPEPDTDDLSEKRP